MNPPALLVENLKYRYRDLAKDHQAVVFDEVSIDCGHCIAILGRSGAGKTTLMKIVAGLLRVDPKISPGCVIKIHGETVLDVEKNGKDGYTPPWNRHVSVMFQHGAGLQGERSVRENILYPLHCANIKGDDAERRIMSLARDCCLHNEEIGPSGEYDVTDSDIDDFLDKKVADLSGGQRQRVALVRCLANDDKKLYMFDEPFTGQDNPLRQILVRKIRGEIEASRESDNPKGFLIVTHNQADAMTIADKIIFIGGDGDQTTVQAQGEPRELYETPSKIRIAQFIGDPTINIWKGRIEAGYIHVNGSRVARICKGSATDREIRIAVRPELIRIGIAPLPPTAGFVTPCRSVGDAWYQGEETIQRIRIEGLTSTDPDSVDTIQMDRATEEKVMGFQGMQLSVGIPFEHMQVFNADNGDRMDLVLEAP